MAVLARAGGILGWMLAQPLILLITEVGAAAVIIVLLLLVAPHHDEDPAEPDPGALPRPLRLAVRRARARGATAEPVEKPSRRKGRKAEQSELDGIDALGDDEPERTGLVPWWRRNDSNREEDPAFDAGGVDGITEVFGPGLGRGQLRVAASRASAAPARTAPRCSATSSAPSPRCSSSPATCRAAAPGSAATTAGPRTCSPCSTSAATARRMPHPAQRRGVGVGEASEPERPYHLPAASTLAAGRPGEGALVGERRRGAPDHGRARPVPGRREGHGLLARSHRDPVRDRARPGRQGRARHRAVEEPRLRGRIERGAHPLADPGQERDRRRDPQCRPRDRDPRRRAALGRVRRTRSIR